MPNIDYKYDESGILQEIQRYIDATYDQHYSNNKIETIEFITDSGYGLEFCLGNIIKYTQRYGRKGDAPTDHRKDLMKIAHYAIMAIHAHDDRHEASYEEELPDHWKTGDLANSKSFIDSCTFRVHVDKEYASVLYDKKPSESLSDLKMTVQNDIDNGVFCMNNKKVKTIDVSPDGRIDITTEKE